jgi:hypothetical protein
MVTIPIAATGLDYLGNPVRVSTGVGYQWWCSATHNCGGGGFQSGSSVTLACNPTPYGLIFNVKAEAQAIDDAHKTVSSWQNVNVTVQEQVVPPPPPPCVPKNAKSNNCHGK